MIDPDGEGGVDPFMVYCDMDSDPTTGITVIKHDNNVSRCTELIIFFFLIIKLNSLLNYSQTILSTDVKKQDAFLFRLTTME